MKIDITQKPLIGIRYLLMQHKNILIMAGGTGGHVYPAIAVAEHLKLKGFKLFWLGTNHGLEKKIVPNHGYPLFKISIVPIRGKGFLRLLSAPFLFIVSLFQALIIIVKIRPVVVLGMGGFVSGPGGIAAWLMHIPLLIHEQNSIAGLTNRLLAPFAFSIMTAFPKVFKKSNKVIVTGNPTREDIREIPEPEKRYVNRDSKLLKVLVLGGSLGAKKLNEIIPETLRDFDSNYIVRVKHQCGERHYASTQKKYKNYNICAEVFPFIEDLVSAYIWADIVICRAGASTISELTACGIASILIPFPFAVDGHQTKNAEYLTINGAAVLVEEEQLNTNQLKQILLIFFNTPELLIQMAIKARKLSTLDAADSVAKLCAEASYA